MTSNLQILLSLWFIWTVMPQCRGQLTGLPQPTLHAITSDEPSVSQPTAVPAQPDSDTAPISNTVPSTQQNPVPPNEPATEELSQVESYGLETLSDTSAMSTGTHATAGAGASHGSFGNNEHTVSSGGRGIPVGAIISVVLALVAISVACVALLVVRRRRQQRTRRAAAGMRQLKLGGSHVKVQTVAISKPMPVQLDVGYSQHYRAQGYEHDHESYHHSRGSSYSSHEPPFRDRNDMYSMTRPEMAGIGTYASIQSSHDMIQSRWSP